MTRDLETKGTRSRDQMYESAVDLLVNPKFRDALDLTKESPAVRERYGMTKIGQSLLLARRLVEAGVTWVAFNEFNHHWDIHGAIENSKKDRVPPLDRAYSALIEDLDQRGLLPSTVVINTGEFGRTPMINKDAGVITGRMFIRWRSAAGESGAARFMARATRGPLIRLRIPCRLPTCWPRSGPAWESIPNRMFTTDFTDRSESRRAASSKGCWPEPRLTVSYRFLPHHSAP